MLGREPVLWIALLQAGIALAVGFGVDITPEQTALLIGFSGAVLAFVTRTQVMPVSTVVKAGTTPDQLNAKAESKEAAREKSDAKEKHDADKRL